MKKFRLLRQHHFNVLHVFCRLRDLGISPFWSRRIARVLCSRIV
ncbi:MAG: hypothetical protein AB1512_17120 [Thermodesulfobacteriota bacterium]